MNRHLFVYGTLRGGLEHPEARWLSEHSERLGAATAKGKLFRIGWYPGLVECGKEIVTGELLLLDDPSLVLERLDIYEGIEQGEYERKESPEILTERRLAPGSIISLATLVICPGFPPEIFCKTSTLILINIQ